MEVIKISFIFASENKDNSFIHNPIMTPSIEILARINEARKQGMSLNRICKELQLSVGVVSRWMRGGWRNKG